jgi:hypothetical protein
VCGKANIYRFTVYNPGTETDTYDAGFTIAIGAGREFYLPACQTVPEGYTFLGWEMNPNPDDGNKWLAVLGEDIEEAGSSVKALVGQDKEVKFYARFLYDLIDSWTWEEDGSSFVVTLTHPQTNFSVEVHYDANQPEETSITSEEEVDDDGNVYGTLFTGHVNWTDPQTGYEYRFIGLQHVQNFDDGQATAISTFPSGAWGADDQATIYYTLDGRRLAGKPTTRGIYVNNGKKIVIK